MRKALSVLAILIVMAFSFKPADLPIKGTWQVIRYQYGADPMVDCPPDQFLIKSYTGTRWSAGHYHKSTKKFDGAGGGTYTLKGNQYVETVEYYSWDSEVVGKTFTFTLTIENGMLHQKGFIEYKGNLKYIIDEWYKQID